MKQKYGFVYIWYDKKRKMFYIGCHWGHVDDGYICSSNRMRDAYKRRKTDFKRRILKTNILSRIELLDEEYKWLSLIDDSELSKKYYNAINKRFGHWSETQDKSGKNHPMFGKTHTEEARKKISLSRTGQSPWNKGKTGFKGPCKPCTYKGLNFSCKDYKYNKEGIEQDINYTTNKLRNTMPEPPYTAIDRERVREELKRKCTIMDRVGAPVLPGQHGIIRPIGTSGATGSYHGGKKTRKLKKVSEKKTRKVKQH
jgi:hypothetical protein